MIECKICNKEYKNLNSLRTHVTRIHDLTYPEYKTKTHQTRTCRYCGVDISDMIHNAKMCKSKECAKKRRLEYNYKQSFKKADEIFKDKTEWEDYVVCKICGLKSANLVSHITRNHKMTTADYKDKFNCDNSFIYSLSHRKNLSDGMKGEKNPAFNHGGKFSPFSKNFVKYENLTDTEKENAIREVKNKQGKAITKNNHINPSYWTKRGYSKEEAEEITSNRQSTFSLEKCLEKYGEDEGYSIWKQRQDQWQKSLNDKTQEEIDIINQKKGIGRMCQLFDSNPIVKTVPGLVYYLRFWSDDLEFWKVGITSRTIRERFSKTSLKNIYGLNYEIIDVIHGLSFYDAFKLEQEILKENKEHRICIDYKGFKTTEAFSKDIWQNS